MEAVLVFVYILMVTVFGHRRHDEWKQEKTDNWDNLDFEASFASWKEEFGKTYSDDTKNNAAFDTFKANWKMINEFNIAGQQSYTMGINQFTDLTSDQFREYISDHTIAHHRHRRHEHRRPHHRRLQQIPKSIDWGNINGKSYVTPVKNQGSCSSQWAFSANGAIESRGAIKYGHTGSKIQTLSEQQLVDCSGEYGAGGCNGGLITHAFEYVQATGGLCLESDYKYTARNGQCTVSCNSKHYPITSYIEVQADSESALMTAVSRGPVSLAVNAAFGSYSSGVFTGNCGTSVNHAVLVVGYGTSGSQKYWKVKNSWSASWGMNGYILICRECDKNRKKGQCGIAMYPSYPVIE